MRGRHGWDASGVRVLAPLLLLVAALLAPAAAGAQVPADTPAQQAAAEVLAHRFSPIVMVRKEQDPPCETTAEQYEPTTVDVTLGNPKVRLEYAPPGKLRGRLIKRAPTAADVADLPLGYYLNLPGSPLGDTCEYARDFRDIKRRGRAPATTYSHVSYERGQTGFALQFWFYWYFNQFNDLHESDWEGMQLWFDEATPEEAVAQHAEPSQMILFQHAGGERAGWDAPKVEKEGEHPVVYPGAGSHATFYTSAVYVENGEHGSGLGCDNTSDPLREVRPRPVLLPQKATTEGPFAWTSFRGNWGQRELGFNDGPTGPVMKHQWHHPYTWMVAQRDSSARLPGGSIAGPAVTGAFCGTVAFFSDLLNAKESNATATFIAIGILLLLLGLFVGFTRWSPVDIAQLRERRAFGQLVRASRQLYGRHWRPMVLIAAAAIPIVGVAQFLVNVFGSGAVGQTIGDVVGAASRPVATAIVSGVVIVFVRSLVTTGRAGFTDSWRGVLQRFGRVVGAELLATLGLVLMALTVVGIPFALWKLVSWSFVQQEVLFADKPIRAAFRGSSDLVRGRWWHTVRAVVLFNVFQVVAGPALTFALIFTALPLPWINLLGSAIYALMLPYVALGETLLYFDLQARAEVDGIKPYRSWRPWHPRTFGRRVAAPSPA
jgi:hypothetical protein